MGLPQCIWIEGYCVLGSDELVYLATASGNILLVKVMNFLLIPVAEVSFTWKLSSAHSPLPPSAESRWPSCEYYIIEQPRGKRPG
jgi:hypothetical protein